jgi:hypothetical protein
LSSSRKARFPDMTGKGVSQCGSNHKREKQ